MSKRSKSRNKKSQNQISRNQIIIFVAIALIVVVGGLALISQNTPNSASDAPAVASSQLISPNDYVSTFESADHVLIDVRTPGEFNGGYIDGAMNIAVETLSSRISEIPTGKPVVVYCRSGNRSAQAADILTQAGFTEVYDLGGIIDWTAAGLPVRQ